MLLARCKQNYEMGAGIFSAFKSVSAAIKGGKEALSVFKPKDKKIEIPSISPDTPTATQDKSKIMLYAGIGIAILVLIFGVTKFLKKK